GIRSRHNRLFSAPFVECHLESGRYAFAISTVLWIIARGRLVNQSPKLFTNMSTQTLPTVLLKPGEADRIIAGHPWIYHGSVLRLTHPAADGELVQVKDHRQRFLGVGFY